MQCLMQKKKIKIKWVISFVGLSGKNEKTPKEPQKRSVWRTINNRQLKQVLVWSTGTGAGSISADDQGLLSMNVLSFDFLVWICWCRWQHLTPIQRGSQTSVTTDVQGWFTTPSSLSDEIPLHGVITRGKTTGGHRSRSQAGTSPSLLALCCSAETWP